MAVPPAAPVVLLARHVVAPSTHPSQALEASTLARRFIIPPITHHIYIIHLAQTG